MTCSRCGFNVGRGGSCPRCGTVLVRAGAASAPGGSGALPRLVGLLALGVAVAAAAFVYLRRDVPTPISVAPPPASEAPVAAPGPAPTDVPVSLARDPTLPAEVQQTSAPREGALALDDVQAAQALAARINARVPLLPEDLATAETLHARYPDEPGIQSLLQGALLLSAQADRAARRYAQAAQYLERAADVGSDRRIPLLILAGVHFDAGDWIASEAAARAALEVDATNAEALRLLGFALYRQDRNREARYALEESLAIEDDPSALAILERLLKAGSDEKGMAERRVAHFNVRYDGGSHETVGREILKALERHYATLARTLDHKPEVAIPVILFTREAYYDASGAPAWSGGVYDNIDGRIRIPIGGLGANLTPDMDGTLIHEVTHAFVADITRGVCPRDVHEGLAQYMEGKRLDRLLSDEQIGALAQGRIQGVAGFYIGALSFVEYLIGMRGQGGMNDLLRAMGEVGNADAAFRQVHGRDHQALKQMWATRLRQRYG